MPSASTNVVQFVLQPQSQRNQLVTLFKQPTSLFFILTLKIADLGLKDALLSDEHLLAGLNIHAGKLTYEAVATAQGRDFVDAANAL